MVVLKIDGKELYVKCLNSKTDEVEFTDNPHDAEDWGDDWRAGTRIKFLKTHLSLGNIHMAKGQENYLESLVPHYVEPKYE